MLPSWHSRVETGMAVLDCADGCAARLANGILLQGSFMHLPDWVGLMACRHFCEQQDKEGDQCSPVCSEAGCEPTQQALKTIVCCCC